MKTGRAANSPLVYQALLAAALMMAWQVAGKATRDSLFLSAFPATALPAMMGGAAVASIVMAVVNAALLRRYGPSRIIPYGYLVGMALHAAEWALLPRAPRLTAVVVYLHVMALGTVLLSGFWALANERFDAREARSRFGQIAAFGTLGLMLGGVIAERVASLASVQGLLVLLAVLQLAVALTLFRFAPAKAAPKPAGAASFPEVISGARYLVGLAGLVILAAMSASSLDYLFKAQAVAHFGKGAPLSRFFALFYTVTSTLTFVVQVGGSKLWLKRFGPGHTVAALPVAVTGVSLAAVFAPGVIALTVGRAIELLIRGSLYRSGYELFYAPMPAAEKRSVKSVIDIGAERLGDGLAGASVQLLLALPAHMVTVAILGLTAALSAAGAWLALRLDRVYVRVLERGLANDEPDSSADISVDLSMQSFVLSPSMPRVVAPGAQRLPLDPAMEALQELRSGDAGRIAATLARIDTLAPIQVPQVIELLDRDDIAQAAYLALKKSGDRVAGQLIDTLRDPASSYKVRSRIPKILASCQSRIAWDGLLAHLLDERFEVRTRCGKALEKINRHCPDYQADRDMIFDAVRNELAATRKLGRSAIREQENMLDRAMRNRASESIEHIFTLLGLVSPRRYARLAFRALQANDGKLRGVALEYLDSILPHSLREELTAYFEGSPTDTRTVLTREEAAELADSNPSMLHRLPDRSDSTSRSKQG